nr:site-specific integrase [uncultured Albidiferax sp.]
MATFKQLPSGNWRAQVRRKGSYASETFRRHKDAQEWALATERRIDLGGTASRPKVKDPTTFGDLINLHVTDMKEVMRAPRRSKAFTLDALQTKLGKVRLKELTRERLIQFGKDRAKEGAGPVTIGMDIGYIKLVVSHAAAVHGIGVQVEPIDLARIALKRLGLVGKGRERDRRPTLDELQALTDYFENNHRQIIPIGRIMRFAIATAMRQDEICRIRWEDIDAKARTVIVRDRKDPRDKNGNDQKVPLLTATGFDAWAILQEQKSFSGRSSLVFPYNGRSVGTAFRRGCKELKIKDLKFHDLRHEAASRLFEAGFTIEQTALVTGHKDWKMLKRYTNLRPEYLHRVKPLTQLSSIDMPASPAQIALGASTAPEHVGAGNAPSSPRNAQGAGLYRAHDASPVGAAASI